MGRKEYNDSILQWDLSYCFLCGRRDRKLDRHECFFGPYRQKCKEDGLWIMLCHYPCHQGPDGAQYNRQLREEIADIAQRRAMNEYGWSMEEWIERYGKNWLKDA